MNYQLTASLVLFLIGVFCCQQVLSAPKETLLNKVFNYQGVLPIRDDISGESAKDDANANNTQVTPSSANLAEAEAACWRLINEQSVITFSLQNKVIDELMVEMKNLTMNDKLREAIEKITTRMRANMKEALDALQRDSADEFFDALFDASEDIIYMSAILREPKMDENVFLTLVKAVSRLGRNNAALIQDFTDMCSFVQRSPRPRTSTLGL